MNFIKHSKFAFIFSALLIIAGMVSLAINGLNFGIDFTGGYILHLDMGQEFTLDEARATLDRFDLAGSSSLQKVGMEGLGEGEKQEIIIRTPPISLNQQEEVLAAFREDFSLGEEAVLRMETVGPAVGEELRKQALLALLVAGVVIVSYITLRFEFRFAMAAIAALLHDVMIVLAFFSLFHLEVNTPFVAAVLTIIGYSVNDTIVIFDRVRENLRSRKKEFLPAIVDLSIGQSLTRSLVTSLTTAFVLIALLVFGGVTLRPFITALLIGVVTGTYSSIFVASPIWLLLKNLQPGGKEKVKTA